MRKLLLVCFCLVALLSPVNGAFTCPVGATCMNGGQCVEPRLYTMIGAGEYVNYALSEDRLYAIGQMYDVINGVGNNPMMPGSTYLVNISSDVKIIDISSGLHHQIALDSNRNVWAWGNSYDGKSFGLQGMGPNYYLPGIPTKILVDQDGLPFTNITQIQAGNSYNAVLKGDGTVYVWGLVAGGLAGDGDTTTENRYFYRPTKVNIGVQVPNTKIVKIAAGGTSVIMALGSDGTAYSWGGGMPGASAIDLGIGTDSNNPWVPAIVKLPTKNIAGLYVGGSSSQFALTSNGTLYGWGMRGQYLGLGDGTGTWYPKNAPFDLTNTLKLPFSVRAVYTSAAHTAVILVDGSMWAWGYNQYGNVGNGEMNSTFYVAKPVPIMPERKDWLEIYTSPNTAYYSYAQTISGELYSWGRSKYAILGNGLLPTLTQSYYNGDFNVPIPTRVDPLKLKYTFAQTAYTCVANHSAPNCGGSIPTDFCHPAHCPTGGACQLKDGGYRFTCDCSSTPHLTGITCNVTVAPITASTGYSCNCPPGFGGRYCETPRPSLPTSTSSSGTTTAKASSTASATTAAAASTTTAKSVSTSTAAAATTTAKAAASTSTTTAATTVKAATSTVSGASSTASTAKPSSPSTIASAETTTTAASDTTSSGTTATVSATTATSSAVTQSPATSSVPQTTTVSGDPSTEIASSDAITLTRLSLFTVLIYMALL